MKPLASLSLDLDNEWSYLKTHGDPQWEALPSYLDVAVPRALDLLRTLDLTITFFVVGQDAALERNRDAIAELARSGHEIGNHSFNHEPWLHRYTDLQVRDELARTEDALADVTGSVPIGFRGPGYSLSPAVLRALSDRDYLYDASTLPTIIGPLARAFYFRSSRLDAAQREERADLFGSATEALRPLSPYRWDVGTDGIVEIPVTTVPGLRVPFHVSYLLYLAGRSPALARAYFRTALFTCRAVRVAPSILLHPLDLLGADDVGSLSFFPGMAMSGKEKRELVSGFLALFAERYEICTVGEHAASVAGSTLPMVTPGERRPSRRAAAAGEPRVTVADDSVSAQLPAPVGKPSVSVIVPAYNESSIILDTLRSLVDYMHTLDDRYRWEIVVVDDGSTDGTGYLAQQMALKVPRVRVLRHRVNFMLGQALRTVFNSCTTDYLVVIDCDLSYSADHIGRLLETIESTQARVVIASPYMPGGRTTAVPPLRNLASRVANQILSIAASGRIRTLTGMVRAYDRRFIASLNLKAMGTEVNTEILYKAQLLRARIEEIPGHLDWTVIEHLPRRSTVRLARGTIRSLISAFFFRPFAFFIAPGFVTIIAALITLGFAVGHPFEEARITYVLGVSLAAAAIMLLSVGMLALQAKRYFEELFHLGTRILREVRGESPTPSNFLEDPANAPAPPGS